MRGKRRGIKTTVKQTHVRNRCKQRRKRSYKTKKYRNIDVNCFEWEVESVSYSYTSLMQGYEREKTNGFPGMGMYSISQNEPDKVIKD